MASALESCLEPGAHNLESRLRRDRALPERNHVGVVVLSRQTRRLRVPANRAPNTIDLVGRNGFAVARAAEHDAAFALARGDGFCSGDDETRIIHRLFGVGLKVTDLVPGCLEHFDNQALIAKAGMIGSDRDLHGVMSPSGSRPSPLAAN